MIEFPQKLHRIHKFQHNGRLYAADLDIGCVVEIDEVFACILDLGASINRDELILELEAKFGTQAMSKAMKKLDSLAATGIFFAGNKESLVKDKDKNISIFVSPFFLRELDSASFVSRLGKYYLISALAKHADMSIGFPMISEDSEAEINFEVEGIKKIPFISNRTFSPAKFVPGECDGLLCLSPYSSYEMPFLRYNHPPAVIRVESDELMRDRIIQPTLDKYFLLRGYDALCFDSSWTRDAFLKLVPFLKDEFPVIQGGINHELFKPQDKVAAKNNIAEAFANPKLKEKPIFLIIPGESIEESVPFITELASSFPGVAFLVLDPFLGDYVKDNLGNLEFFKVQDAQDNDVMSVIFNAADIAFFPAVLEVPCTYVLSVLACGVPMIVAGEERIPEEVGNAGVFIKGNRDSYGTFIAPIELVSKELKFLLSYEAKRLSLGANAIKQASTYTWDKTAIKFVELFKELKKLGESAQRQRKTVFPMAFLLGYVPSDKSVRSRAIQLPSFRERPMYDALAMTLLVEHTSAEVEAVLTHLFKEQKKAKEILFRVSCERVLSESN